VAAPARRPLRLSPLLPRSTTATASPTSLGTGAGGHGNSRSLGSGLAGARPARAQVSARKIDLPRHGPIQEARWHGERNPDSQISLQTGLKIPANRPKHLNVSATASPRSQFGY
jgi:hypothetical protein